MNADAVIIWVATWGPLVTLSSTVLLAAITAWLAYLTKVMADSAQKAAEQSRIAAEASLASVAAAEASIDVRFDVEPYITSTAGETRRALEILELGGLNLDDEVPAGFFSKISAWRGVRLTCRGATVTVHGLKVTYVSVEDRSDPDSNFTKTTGTSQDLELVCTDDLPRLCHVNEVIEFQVPDRPVDEALVEFTTVLSYSFGAGPVRQREMKWRKPPEAKHHRADERDDVGSSEVAPTEVREQK